MDLEVKRKINEWFRTQIEKNGEIKQSKLAELSRRSGVGFPMLISMMVQNGVIDKLNNDLGD